MRVVLDTSVLIASERQNQECSALLRHLRQAMNVQRAAVSAMSIVELTHGIYRARTKEQGFKRREFVDDVLDALNVYPITIEIAQRAGQIEGEQANCGIRIDTADLLIGTTALIAGSSVITSNPRHFQRIPGLEVVPFVL